MDANQLKCSVCQCKFGSFDLEGDELVLEFACGHESAGLILNLNFIGYEEETDRDGRKVN